MQELIRYLLLEVIELEPTSRFTISLDFFLYDTFKITALLFIISTVMSFINAYLPVEKIRDFLYKTKLFGLEYFLASFFGAITPFCSCSSVPLFVGFVKGGIPLGVTFAFLVTSPLVNEVAIAMFIGIFGFKVTFIYALSGILIGMSSGFILGKLKLEKYLTDWVKELLNHSASIEPINSPKYLSLTRRILDALSESLLVIKGIILYVLVGIGIGSVIHGFVPDQFFVTYIQKDNLFAVPIAVLIGIPLYSNAAGVIPIIQVLISKGVPLGTGLAFMMATVGLSLPEAMLLKKIMQLKLLLIFFSVVGLSIILLGYLFNLIF
jgi:uncharacterized protein